QIIFRECHGNDNEDLITSTKLIPRNRTHGTATLGLLVHSAVDGVALGAAAASAHSHVEFVIFLAIMLHKAPAAFGLTSILQKIGYDRRKIKRHLFAFSITAPIVSIL
ncbi:ZIP family metal transporter, partial [Salmonella sp. s51228]|uniref:ZIP family metal transporter n=1 Tax=Salmonella sp. s51228 TaxID=3159652 RepID=UPI00397EC612